MLLSLLRRYCASSHLASYLCMYVFGFYIQLGLESYESVGIMGSNSVEWFSSSLGAVFAGYVEAYGQKVTCYMVMHVLIIFRGFATGIHISSNAETCHYILKDCQARIAVVKSHKHLNRIAEVMQISYIIVIYIIL